MKLSTNNPVKLVRQKSIFTLQKGLIDIASSQGGKGPILRDKPQYLLYVICFSVRRDFAT
jgi:hypothetical protein